MTWQQEFNDKRLADGGWYGCIVNDGWKKIVLETDSMLAHIDPNYKICQVKEKWGELRYYFASEIGYDTIERNIMDAIVRSAESRSRYVCEQCGKFGELRTNRAWIVTLCNTCEEAREAEYQRRKANLNEMRKISDDLGEYE